MCPQTVCPRQELGRGVSEIVTARPDLGGHEPWHLISDFVLMNRCSLESF